MITFLFWQFACFCMAETAFAEAMLNVRPELGAESAGGDNSSIMLSQLLKQHLQSKRVSVRVACDGAAVHLDCITALRMEGYASAREYEAAVMVASEWQKRAAAADTIGETIVGELEGFSRQLRQPAVAAAAAGPGAVLQIPVPFLADASAAAINAWAEVRVTVDNQDLVSETERIGEQLRRELLSDLRSSAWKDVSDKLQQLSSEDSNATREAELLGHRAAEDDARGGCPLSALLTCAPIRTTDDGLETLTCLAAQLTEFDGLLMHTSGETVATTPGAVLNARMNISETLRRQLFNLGERLQMVSAKQIDAEVYTSKLAQLKSRDDWFSEEHRFAMLRLNCLKAARNELVMVQRRLQAAVAAKSDLEQIHELFRVFTESGETVARLRCDLAVANAVLENTQRLHHEGQASWAELRAAQLVQDECRRDCRLADLRRQLAENCFQLLQWHGTARSSKRVVEKVLFETAPSELLISED